MQSRAAAHPEGQGTTFTVGIPAKQVKRISPEDDFFESSEAPSLLVVDELSDVRDSLVDVTRRLGHACRAVGSAAEARPLLTSTHFDEALIDLEMPDTDGLALETEIRDGGGPSSSAVLILICAAENRAAGQDSPFDGFFPEANRWPGLSPAYWGVRLVAVRLKRSRRRRQLSSRLDSRCRPEAAARR